MRIDPLPNGQIPAMARNSVDLPAPDGPVTNVDSLARMLKLSAETSGLPFGNVTSSCASSIAPEPDATTSIDGFVIGSFAALSIDISKPSSRATVERQSASVL